jgi:hypothetical protein
MIQIYTQYSYGGFRIYKIDGVAKELLDSAKEVTRNNFLGYPESAAIFFDRGMTKVAYRYLSGSDKFVLTVKEIPSLDSDSDGRPINCAVQFIGDKSDRKTIDNIAISICNGLKNFEEFFAGLFYIRSGFHIDGDRLKAYIDSFNGDIHFSGESQLLDVRKKKTGVILFVPLSVSFFTDDFVRCKIKDELQFSDGDMKNSIVILYQELLKQQGRLKQSPDPNMDKDDIEDNVRPMPVVNNNAVEDNTQRSEIAELKQQITDLKKNLNKAEREKEELDTKRITLSKDNEELKRRCGMLSDEINELRRKPSLLVPQDEYKEKYEFCKKMNKYLLYILGAAVLIILLMLIF